jgi:hypothetical protein
MMLILLFVLCGFSFSLPPGIRHPDRLNLLPFAPTLAAVYFVGGMVIFTLTFSIFAAWLGFKVLIRWAFDAADV